MDLRTSSAKRAYIAAGLAAVLLAATPAIYRDYRAFLDLSPGGLPHDIRGWLVSNILSLFASSDSLASRPFKQLLDEGDDDHTWLHPKTFPYRDGTRPSIGRHCVPHRQVDQTAPTTVARAFVEAFRALASRNQDLLELRPSGLEKRGEAIFLSSSQYGSANPRVRHAVDKQLRRELVHVHSYGKVDGSTVIDYSAHATLSPKDCMLALERGWGERFPLAGGPLNIVPSNYIMLYAPRSMKEVEVVLQMMRAGIAYLSGREIT